MLERESERAREREMHTTITSPFWSMSLEMDEERSSLGKWADYINL